MWWLLHARHVTGCGVTRGTIVVRCEGMEYVFTKGVGWHPRPPVEYKIVEDYDGYKYRMEFRKPKHGEFFFYLMYYGEDQKHTQLIDKDGKPQWDRCEKHAKRCRYKRDNSPIYGEGAILSVKHHMTLVPLDP